MLQIKRVGVSIETATILHETSLQVAEGEIVAVLGPSGAGKTTLLRAVAGLAPVESGDITWAGESIVTIPTHERGFGLMFQGFALFPHLDVAGNVGFGLKMASHEDIDGAVEEALAWVGLPGFGQRRIDSLSGGEKQRVALARTLAPQPRLVMLDEPLGSLDRNLRTRLMGEIREILKARRVTSIVVTHDREEAVAMSDRLALMREGIIVQEGTIEDILAHPFDDWVTDFVG